VEGMEVVERYWMPGRTDACGKSFKSGEGVWQPTNKRVICAGDATKCAIQGRDGLAGPAGGLANP